MKKLDFDILTIDKIFGVNRLKIFKERSSAYVTDFSILLGCTHSPDNSSLEKRTGYYWTKSLSHIDVATKYMIMSVIDGGYASSKCTYIGTRPTLPLSQLQTISSNKVKYGTIEFGEYPQQAAPKHLQQVLEDLYKSDTLNKTGKIYTTSTNHFEPFEALEHIEYEYNDKKYVRVIPNTNNRYAHMLTNNTLSLGAVWIEVQPIKWIVDIENDIAVTDKIIFAGIPFESKDYYDSKKDFNETDIKKFMDDYFSKEILPIKYTFRQEDIQNLNPKQQILENSETATIKTETNEEKQVVYVKKHPNM